MDSDIVDAKMSLQENHGVCGVDEHRECLHINQIIVRNRLVLPPMATAKAAEGGRVTDELCEYYAERAKYGGFGLIIAEHSYIHPQGRASVGQLSMAENADIPGLRRMTDAIHPYGVSVFAQISHAGGMTNSKVTGEWPVAPSAVLMSNRADAQVPREITAEEIHQIPNLFAQAALRAKEAGFDGVEIHSAHGYLLNQFYSPITNRRADAYGAQTMENRVRLHVETIRAVRSAVGAAYPIAIRLGGCDYRDGGSTIADCVEACRIFEQEGVDLIDLSGGLCGFMRPDRKNDPGYFSDMSSAVKKAVCTPVLLTGGIQMPSQAEALIRDGAADLIGVGRAAYQNAHWADETSALR